MAMDVAERINRIYYPGINVRIRRDDGHFYDDLLDAAYLSGMSPAEFLRIAAKEKIEREKIK